MNSHIFTKSLQLKHFILSGGVIYKQVANIRHSSVLASGKAETLSEGIYTKEHFELQNSLKKLIDTHINPYVDQWEKDERFPMHEVFKKLGDGGFLGVTKPIEYGGLGLDYSYAVAMTDAMCHVNCGGVPLAVAVQTDMATPALSNFGSDFLKKEFLAPSISGDMVTCIAVSEPNAGSDVASIRTSAKRVGDDLIIKGHKMWITNAFQGDWMCLLANTSQDSVHRNKSLIIVPFKTPGVHLGKKIDTIGMKCSNSAEVFLEDVRVPAKYIIGDAGMGFTYQMLQFERLCGAILACGSLQRCIDETINYTKERVAFGKPIISNQYIHYTLAELQTELECLKALIFRAANASIQGTDVTPLASMCKLKAGRLSRSLADSCIQFWGGMGFTNDVIVSRMYRDLRLSSVGGGADEVMLSIICKYMGILPKASSKSK